MSFHRRNNNNNSEEALSVKNESFSSDNSPTGSPKDQGGCKDEALSGMDGKRYALRWRHHQSTVVAEVGSLYRDAALVDVTLACEDQRTYQAHKLVLSACSQYFQSLFSRHPAHQHPIIFLKDVRGDECEALLTYMYRGEVSVNQDQIPRILRVASSLQVRGLAEVETQSSRPISPITGDRSNPCASSSPSPSTGPPTKCATPISEPNSPNPPAPLLNPQVQSLASSLCPHNEPIPIPARHPSSLGGALIGAASASHHPTISQDFAAYHLLPHTRHPYDLSSGSILGPLVEQERKRQDEKGTHQPSLGGPYAPPQLRVKQDLGGNSWEGNSSVDVGGLSPLSLTEGPRTSFLPHAIFSSFLGQEHNVPSGSQSYGRMFPISDPLRRVDRLCGSGNESRIHKCQYCSRKFKRKDHLKTHVRIHTGERPYKCKICGRGFIQSQQVKIHMKVHVREDASSGASSVLGVGTEGRTLAAFYPEIVAHYGDRHLSDRIMKLSRDSSNNADVDPSQAEHTEQSVAQHVDNVDDSDNEFGSDPELESVEDPSKGSLSGANFRNPTTSTASFAPSQSPTTSPTPSVTTNHSGRRSTTPLNMSPHEDKSCGAIAMKDSYYLATSVKK